MKYAKRLANVQAALNKWHIMFLDCIFDNTVCKVVFPVKHKTQQQQQELINKKKRILIVDGDKLDSYATLKLDLERNGFIVPLS